MVNEGAEKTANDQRVEKRVTVFQQRRRNLKAILFMLHRRIPGVAAQIPDVPFIEGDHNVLLTALVRFHIVGGADDGLDKVVHIDEGGQEVAFSAFVFIILVAGDVIDVVVKFLEYNPIPGGEGIHHRA